MEFRRIIEKAKSLDAYLSFLGWGQLPLAALGLTGAALMAWAFSTWVWFWGNYRWAGVGTVALLTWIVLTVGFFLIAVAAKMFRPIAAKETHAEPVALINRDLSPELPLIEISINTALLVSQVPWLQFDCAGFNGTHHIAHIESAGGRVNINGEDFHGNIELVANNTTIQPNAIFTFTVRLPLSESEKVFLRKLACAQNSMMVRLLGAYFKTNVYALPNQPAQSTQVNFPANLLFDKGGGKSHVPAYQSY